MKEAGPMGGSAKMGTLHYSLKRDGVDKSLVGGKGKQRGGYRLALDGSGKNERLWNTSHRGKRQINRKRWTGTFTSMKQRGNLSTKGGSKKEKARGENPVPGLAARQKLTYI